MEVHGLTCSVGYAAMLAHGGPRWRAGLDSLSIVTDLRDEATVALAARLGAKVHRTGVFYEGGDFRKAAALEECRRALVPRTGWLLLFDADIIPPADWRAVVEREARHGYMHGAARHQCDDPARPDPALWPEIRTDGRRAMGYFQLFAQDDPRAYEPVLDGRWKHAGVYDTVLCDRWPAHLHRRLTLRVSHLGARDNWGGLERGPAYVRELMERRKAHGGRWDHEAVG